MYMHMYMYIVYMYVLTYCIHVCEACGMGSLLYLDDLIVEYCRGSFNRTQSPFKRRQLSVLPPFSLDLCTPSTYMYMHMYMFLSAHVWISVHV